MQCDTILFDINETVLDLSPLKSKFKAAFGTESAVSIWFSMLLHSACVCALTGVKTNFAILAGTMLDAVAQRLGIELSDIERNDILNAFARLPPHADIKPALSRLRFAGYSTVAFSNSSLDLIATQLEGAGLSNYFDEVISVEEAGSFKPDRKVYNFGARRIGRPIETLRLVAAHDWDTHGALTAGMKAAYINRTGAPYHAQYRQPEITATTMGGIVEQILTHDGVKI